MLAKTKIMTDKSIVFKSCLHWNSGKKNFFGAVESDLVAEKIVLTEKNNALEW